MTEENLAAQQGQEIHNRQSQFEEHNFPRAVTFTCVYRHLAPNGDEKISENALSVKKITLEGRTHTFISKYALRYHIFNTLQKSAGWLPCKVIEKGGKNKKVAQLSVEHVISLLNQGNSKPENVEKILFEPLAFGYLYTSEEQSNKGTNNAKDEKTKKTISRRKAAVGITKAISINPFYGDVAFYANHDFAARALMNSDKEGTGSNVLSPSPFSKEEHIDWFYASYVIDVDRIAAFDSSELPKSVAEKLGIINEIAEKNRNTILEDLLKVFFDGFSYQVSGESYPAVPVFVISAGVNIPAPVFHGLLKFSVIDGKLLVEGLDYALRNNWLETQVFVKYSDDFLADETVNIIKNSPLIKIISEEPSFTGKGYLEHFFKRGSAAS